MRAISKTSSRLAALMAGAAVVAMAPGAMAGVKVYTSAAAFHAAVPGASVENYGSYAAGQLIPDGSSLGGITYSFNTASGRGGVITNIYNSFTGNSLAAKQTAGGLGSLDFFYPGEGFTASFGTGLHAIGIWANINLPTTLSLSVAGGGGANLVTVYEPGTTFGFLGLVSDTPFSSATFWTDNVFNTPAIEFGVPEPAVWGLMIAGFGLVGATLRRRATAAT